MSGDQSASTRTRRLAAKCSCTTSSGRYAKPRPARAELRINGIALNASGPPTGSFSSRPSLANGQDQRPPEVGSPDNHAGVVGQVVRRVWRRSPGEVGRRTDKRVGELRPAIP